MTIDVPLAESKTFDFYEAWRWAGHWKSEAIFRGLHPSSQLGSAGGTPRKNDTTDKSNGKKRRPDVVGAEDASLCESRQQNLGPHLLKRHSNTLKEMKARMVDVDLTLFVSLCFKASEY